MAAFSFRASLCCAFASAALILPLAAQAEWTKREELHARRDHAMVYDAANQRVLLLGGTFWENVYGTHRSLWERRAGGEWTFVQSTPEMPEPSAAWDVARGELFAISDRHGTSSALWRWSGGSWISITEPLELMSAAGAELVYHPPTSETLLFVQQLSPPSVAVLAWNGSAFVRRSSGSGPAWGDWKLVYDAPLQRLLAIGAPFGGLLLETWRYSGNTWQPIATTNTPPARHWAAIAFDPSWSTPLVACGFDQRGTNVFALDDAWRLQGTLWLPAGALGAANARGHASAAGDLPNGELVLFGGSGLTAFGPQPFGDTWTKVGSSWNQIDIGRALDDRTIGATAYDPARRRTLAITWKANVTTTWEHDGQRWTAFPNATSPSYDSPAVYDPRTGDIVLVDGGGTTWLWDGVRWTLGASGLPSSTNRALAWDGARVLLVEGGTISGGSPTSIWFWDGPTRTWTPGSAGQIPPGGFEPQLAYDERRGVVALFYENSFGGPTAHYEWNGASWSTSSARYPGRRRFAAGYHPARGRLVIAGGETWNPLTSRSTDTNNAYEFDGAGWRQINFLPWPGSGFFLGGQLVATPEDRLVWLGAQDRGFHSQLENHALGTANGAEIETFGSACGGASGTPRFLYPSWQRPWLGEVLSLRAANLPASATLVTLFYGLRRDAWGSIALPLDLGPAGLPGCELLVALDAVQTLPANQGSASWAVTVPNVPQLLGAEVFEQLAAFDPTANPGGAVLSDGLALRVGRR
ncbi:MAG: hypothetical protein JNM84_01180 [Planctomycetes bacterium]|nr:hypothetical protein [Planctomycetota bacterium]